MQKLLHSIRQRALIVTLTAMALALSAATTFAQSITIDPQPIFDGISNNLPWIMDLFSLPIGIQVGVVIVAFFGTMLIGAFTRIRSL